MTHLPDTRFGIPPIVAALRPQQWPKNAIVFAAVVFSAGDAWTARDLDSLWPLLWRSAALFALWCPAASGTYLVNDLRDRELDRIHPRKANRPIASGAVSPTTAVTVAVLLLAVAFVGSLAIDWQAGLVLGGYITLMLGYSLGLKRVAVLDVMILGGGVIARAVSGALAMGVTISPWLYVCSSFAALFLGISKRWAEYRQLGEAASRHRPALAHYTEEILGHMVIMSGAGALLSYALYSIESVRVPDNGAMALTIPFVTFGMFRYLLLISGPRATDAPDQVLFTDPQIIVAVGAFLLTAMAVLLWG